MSFQPPVGHCASVQKLTATCYPSRVSETSRCFAVLADVPIDRYR